MKKAVFTSFLALFLIMVSQTAYAAFPVKTGKASTEVVAQTDSNAQDADFNAAAVPASSGKSQLTALLLAVLVGALGIHRFYLGYIWQGVVQLLTLGGLGVWALIDLVRIATGDLQPKDGNYTETL
ncbi:MAG: hypothetical protein CR968_05160 [Flavobacteriia bacterium]|nr:MAG: hypothetical protein CR968_05160 [Flavobacteriia bacterium]